MALESFTQSLSRGYFIALSRHQIGTYCKVGTHKESSYFCQIGDLLRVNLRSNIDNSLLFSAPVHASIVAARPSRRRSEDEVGGGAEGDGGGRPPSPNQWEGQKTSSTHVAVEGSLSLSSRFWPNPEADGGTHDTGEDDNDVGGGGNLTDDQLDNIAEASAAATSQWKRADGRGWNHLSEQFETPQVRFNLSDLKDPDCRYSLKIESTASGQTEKFGEFKSEIRAIIVCCK